MKADIDGRDDDDMTPILIASKLGNREVKPFLFADSTQTRLRGAWASPKQHLAEMPPLYARVELLSDAQAGANTTR